MKILLLRAILCFVCFGAFAQDHLSPHKQLKRYRYAAEEAFKGNDFGLALDYAKKVDSLAPNQIEFIYIIGVSYLYSHTKIEALPKLLIAKSKHYKPKEINYYLGQAYHYSNKFDTAIAYFKKHLTIMDTSFTASEEEKAKFAEIKAKIAQCLYGKQMVKDSLHVEIKNLGPSVNTKFSEYVPVVNADESVMYFTSRRPSTTEGKMDIDNKYFEDIYMSNFEGGEWKSPKNIGSPINDDDHDACIGISPDAQRLFIYRSKSARAASGNILMSTLDGNQWRKPKKLGSNINSKKGWESSMCLTPDGKRLYFSSDRPGGFGGVDIYFSELNSEGEWGTPINVGSPINTPDNEDAPFMHFDGKTLFFSSDGHKTIGGYDIFTSTYQADSLKWTKPLNIGYPVSTADDDAYFVYSANGSKGYFSAHRKDSYGEKDIYVVHRPNADPNMIVLAGRVLDRETQEPIFATVTITNLETQKVIGVFNTNKLTGKYVLALNFGVNHSVAIQADGYIFNSENVNVPNNEFKFQHNQDFYMDKVKAGAKTTLNNLFFDFEKSNLRPQSITELDQMYELLMSNPNWLVEISGHTDSIGPAEYNMGLSKERALAVVNYLIGKGVKSNSLVAIGYGETKPVATNGTEEGRQQNRRTDLTIKEIYSDAAALAANNPLMSASQLNINHVLEKVEGDTSAYKMRMKVHFLIDDGDNLTEYSKKELNEILNVLKSNPTFKLKVLPSTDLTAGEYNNKKLYDLRARTVIDYLVDNGLAKERIIVQDFVPTKEAKVTDRTKADIKRRRVEFLLVK